MSDMLVGIFALILGLAIAFTVLYLWSVMLPIWGFVVGFFNGVAGAGLAMTPSSNAMLYAVVATGRSLPRRCSNLGRERLSRGALTEWMSRLRHLA
jgi:hypothetical protein